MKYFQSLCKSIGDNACYLLCLIDVAEEYLNKELNKLEVIEQCIKNKYVMFNENNFDDFDNFYVNHPTEILKMLTGKNWNVRKEVSSYEAKENDYVIEMWSINGYTGHFARMNKGFNSLQNSNCVKRGKISSYRIFNVVG